MCRTSNIDNIQHLIAYVFDTSLFSISKNYKDEIRELGKHADARTIKHILN